MKKLAPLTPRARSAQATAASDVTSAIRRATVLDAARRPRWVAGSARTDPAHPEDHAAYKLERKYAHGHRNHAHDGAR